jgi:hypothetical protein
MFNAMGEGVGGVEEFVGIPTIYNVHGNFQMLRACICKLL